MSTGWKRIKVEIGDGVNTDEFIVWTRKYRTLQTALRLRCEISVKLDRSKDFLFRLTRWEKCVIFKMNIGDDEIQHTLDDKLDELL